MKKLIITFTLTLAAALISILPVRAADFELTFTPSTSESSGLVTGYSAWWQATNAADANQWTWIGSCAVGQTNILFDSTNLPNAVWITATSSSDTLQSYNAEPIFFDTNDYPVTVIPPTAPAVPLRPLAPMLLKLRRL